MIYPAEIMQDCFLVMAEDRINHLNLSNQRAISLKDILTKLHVHNKNHNHIIVLSIRFMKFVLFGLRFNIPVKSYGHVKTVS